MKLEKANSFPNVVNVLMDTTYFVKKLGVMVNGIQRQPERAGIVHAIR